MPVEPIVLVVDVAGIESKVTRALLKAGYLTETVKVAPSAKELGKRLRGGLPDAVVLVGGNSIADDELAAINCGTNRVVKVAESEAAKVAEMVRQCLALPKGPFEGDEPAPSK